MFSIGDLWVVQKGRGRGERKRAFPEGEELKKKKQGEGRDVGRKRASGKRQTRRRRGRVGPDCGSGERPADSRMKKGGKREASLGGGGGGKGPIEWTQKMGQKSNKWSKSRKRGARCEICCGSKKRGLPKKRGHPPKWGGVHSVATTLCLRGGKDQGFSMGSVFCGPWNKGCRGGP